MKVLLVDDHTLFREGVSSFLTRLDDAMVFFHADNPRDACLLAEQESPFDLVLLDYSIPGVTGLDLYFSLRERVKSTPITLLTGENNSQLIQTALQAGINGYITKNSTPEVMLSALKLILSGGLYIPSQILAAGAIGEQSFIPSTAPNFTDIGRDSASVTVRPSTINLTCRQQEVLEELAKGYSNKEIARELGMSPSTVKVHVASILRELEVKNRTRAVTMAQDLGLISG